ncbi:hypothetical protein TNIN_261801 [Trichonephila inaurata madagascariensis]|uniref:Uncharacterized protein n=1 Tax=Trichonephila inaurata madagascariensis TaxID=2747483 RepID=A0A8X6YGJ9_9ARAC|nr:hypothetical protein TNIN_261801 [Trichonephila inaurata madagascariensis]
MSQGVHINSLFQFSSAVPSVQSKITPVATMVTRHRMKVGAGVDTGSSGARIPRFKAESSASANPRPCSGYRSEDTFRRLKTKQCYLYPLHCI